MDAEILEALVEINDTLEWIWLALVAIAIACWLD